MKTYYQKHRAKLKAYQAAWAAANPDRIRVHRRTYYMRNSVAICARNRAYYYAHREDRLAYARARRTSTTGEAALPARKDA